MKILVTGCAGFIGSNLVHSLLKQGYKVHGIDNFSTGSAKNLQPFINHPHFKCFTIDLLNLQHCKDAMLDEPNIVFHLAANADIRHGLEHPTKDIEQYIIATSNVLEAMRVNDVKRIVFTSTGSVYGDNAPTPTPENAPFPIQTSLYATSKIAAEGLISSYCTGFGFSAVVFRLVSVLGKGYTHGHVIDFYRQLRRHPEYLRVLGDGRQCKSYMDVEDCIQGILLAIAVSYAGRFEIFNLGTDETFTVRQSVDTITSALMLDPDIDYLGGDCGWAGDNTHIQLDCTAIRTEGWAPRFSIKEGIFRTLNYLQQVESTPRE